MTDAADREYRAELTTFQCKECYVYRPPPASSIGHRAEFWDVGHWLQVKIACCPDLPSNLYLPETLSDQPLCQLEQEVSLRIVTSDEDCTIRTYDIKTGVLVLVLVPQLIVYNCFTSFTRHRATQQFCYHRCTVC